jgi:hypothetical protein
MLPMAEKGPQYIHKGKKEATGHNVKGNRREFPLPEAIGESTSPKPFQGKTERRAMQIGSRGVQQQTGKWQEKGERNKLGWSGSCCFRSWVGKKGGTCEEGVIDRSRGQST